MHAKQREGCYVQINSHMYIKISHVFVAFKALVINARKSDTDCSWFGAGFTVSV